MAPALWNGYPLLQWDTGGYLARWYEGYLVPSRSTVFGLYLHLGEDSSFWINLGYPGAGDAVAAAPDPPRVRLVRPLRLMAMSVVLILATALPWLASMLLTDIFAGLSVLSLFILVLYGDEVSMPEKLLLFAFTAFAAATHSATLTVLLGLVCAGLDHAAILARAPTGFGAAARQPGHHCRRRHAARGEFRTLGKLAWTPGGYGVSFGRMLQDGIVARYLGITAPGSND